MRMWLADEPPLQDEPGSGSGSGSPPLEGGEALCDFVVDSSRQDIQHISVLRHLPSLLDENKTACLKDVFPKIQAALPLSHTEVPLDAGSPFVAMLEKELVPSTTFTQTFLQSILTSVDSKDPVVANAWLETLMDILDLLPPTVIKTDILRMAVTKGQHSQPVQFRLTSCNILGHICDKFEPYFIKQEILPVVQSLCQDVDYEVRSCIARQLDAVARGLGLEVAKSAILPWLVELANDESSHVRLASIETVVNMLSMLDDETCIQTIIPLVKKFCDTSLRMKDAALPVAAQQLGRLCHGLSVNLQKEEKEWFLNFYQQLSKLGLPLNSDHDTSNKMPDLVPVYDGPDKYVECKKSCAFNFPAMVLFALPSNFKDDLYETFCDLVSDPHSEVRRTMACCLHEVAKLLGSNVNLLQPQLVQLLQDDNIEVLEGLIPNLHVTLEALAREGSMNTECKLHEAGEIVNALIFCEHVVSQTTYWRLHADFLDKLSCLPRCLTSDEIHKTFVPLFFHKLYTARPLPCRESAARTLLLFLRNIPVQEHRVAICNRLVEELCNGYSCHKRMLFITVCALVMDLFSKIFFKTHFFMSLLQLADDPVPNVRLRLCSLLPSLKSLLKLPEDQIFLQNLEACVGKLMANEKDRDVSAALRDAIMELDTTDVTDCTHKQLTSIDDAVDLAKEEEEKLLMQLEKKLQIGKTQATNGTTNRTTGGFRQSRIPYLGRKISTGSSTAAGSGKKDNSSISNGVSKTTYSSKSPLISQDQSRSPSPDYLGSETSGSQRPLQKPTIPRRTVSRTAIPLPSKHMGRQWNHSRNSVITSNHASSSNTLANMKVLPGSPMPSPETLRKVSIPSSSSALFTKQQQSHHPPPQLPTSSSVYRSESRPSPLKSRQTTGRKKT